MATDLEGKIAVVTGGGRGIGRAVSVGLARRGAAVAVNFAEDASAAAEVAAEISGAGGRVLVVKADVSDEAQVGDMFDEVERLLGPVSILVANAGITRDGLAMRMPVADFDAVISTNLRGAFLCAKAALRPMVKGRWGRIVFVSSVSGVTGNAGQANYAASKAGLIGLAKSIAREVAVRGVTANVVAPGFIETDMTSGLGEEVRQEVASRVPVGRFGDPAEVASLVGFLCSEEASYICGAVVPVDGGLSM